MSGPAPSAAPSIAQRQRGVRIAGAAVAIAIPLVALLAWQWLVGMAELRRSDLYGEAVERARSHPRVVEVLGEPVEPGWWVRGDAEPRGTSGRARLTVPLTGPGGRGRLDAEARRQGEVWRFDRLEVVLPGDEVVDLLAAPAPPVGTGDVATAPGRPVPLAAAPLPLAPRLSPPPAPWHDPGIERRS